MDEAAVFSGELKKKARGKGGLMSRANWKKRFFKLTSTTLSYYESFEDMASPKGVIDVSSITGISLTDEGQYGFVVTHHDISASTMSTKVLSLQCTAETSKLREDWIAAINQVLSRDRDHDASDSLPKKKKSAGPKQCAWVSSRGPCRQTADPRSGNKLYCKAHSCPHPSCMGGRGSRDPGCEKHGGPPSTQPVIPKKKKKEKEMLAVGTRVTVSGYEACAGTIRFSGNHVVDGKPRYGVELDQPIGKNSGVIKGHAYFSCPDKHGVLVGRPKVMKHANQTPPRQVQRRVTARAGASSSGNRVPAKSFSVLMDADAEMEAIMNGMDLNEMEEKFGGFDGGDNDDDSDDVDDDDGNFGNAAAPVAAALASNTAEEFHDDDDDDDDDFGGFGDEPPAPAPAPAPAPLHAAAVSAAPADARKCDECLSVVSESAGTIDEDDSFYCKSCWDEYFGSDVEDAAGSSAMGTEAESDLPTATGDAAKKCEECDTVTLVGVLDDVDGSWYCQDCWDMYMADLDDSDLGINLDAGGASAVSSEAAAAIAAATAAAVRAAAAAEDAESDGDDDDDDDSSDDEEDESDDDAADEAAGALGAAAIADVDTKTAATKAYSVRYHGHVGVVKSTGADVVDDAADKLANQAIDGYVKGPTPVSLSFTRFGFSIKQPGGGGSELFLIDKSQITFSHVSGDSMLGIITTDPATKVMLCHIIDVSSADAKTVFAVVQVQAAAAAKKLERICTSRGSQSARAKGRAAQVSTDVASFARTKSVRLPSADRGGRAATERGKGGGGGGGGRGPPAAASAGAKKPGGLKGRTLSVRRISSEVMSNQANVGRGLDDSAPIGINVCTFLGSVGVSGQTGMTTALSAVKRLAARKEMATSNAACIVSMQGMKVVEITTSESVADLLMKNITDSIIIDEFETLELLEGKTQGGSLQPVLVAISINAQLGMISAHLFQFISVDVAKEIKAAIDQCSDLVKSQTVMTIKKSKKGGAGGAGGGASVATQIGAAGGSVDPFAATSETNANVPASLVPYHIPRAKLVGQRVLGNGAFGQ